MLENVNVNFEYVGNGFMPSDSENKFEMHKYNVTIGYNGKKGKFDFYIGKGYKVGDYDKNTCLDCLFNEHSMLQEYIDFYDFMACNGYENNYKDTKVAKRVYNQMIKNSAKLDRIFGNDLHDIHNEIIELMNESMLG